MDTKDLMKHLCKEIDRLRGSNDLTVILALVDNGGVTSTIQVSSPLEESFPSHIMHALTILTGTYYKQYMDKENYQFLLQAKPENMQ